jgi:uncharacterized peroxidase-related enzyme
MVTPPPQPLINHQIELFMAHIKLNNEQLPGIVGLLDYCAETAKPLSDLAEVLLADDNNSLSKGEREIIAASVSYKNDCHFCHSSHGAAAAAHFNKGPEFLDEIKSGLAHTPVSDKLRALLQIAHQVQKGGKHVTHADIQEARKQGATDREIHDTVLIAAAFCMYNRYVDGLATWAPQEDMAYMGIGKQLAEHGYLQHVVPA